MRYCIDSAEGSKQVMECATHRQTGIHVATNLYFQFIVITIIVRLLFIEL